VLELLVLNQHTWHNISTLRAYVIAAILTSTAQNMILVKTIDCIRILLMFNIVYEGSSSIIPGII
jgi:hypothetical protein